MKLSYVVITWNRRETLLQSLEQVRRVTPLPSDQWEMWVVDNASTDGTAEAVTKAFPQAKLLRLAENLGMPARNRAIARATGQYVMLLDDDSHPTGDTVPRMLDYLDAHPQTAALTGRVLLPNGAAEASAMPSVLIGCASCIRRSALSEVGLFPEEFFRQAEEYDLSFRLWNAGYSVERFDDLEFRHNKVLGGRSSALTVRMDLRNNLILADRYLPARIARLYREDWIQRYMALARHLGHQDAAMQALQEADTFRQDAALLHRPPLTPAATETIFELDRQAHLVHEFAETHKIRRVVVADYSKNLYATVHACRQAGLEIAAIADSRPAFVGLNYRHIDVVPEDAAIRTTPDAIIVSNVNPAQVDPIVQRLSATFAGPVLRLWHPRRLADQASLRSVA